MTPRLLWSGGFDSTFRLLERLYVGDRVEVVYVNQGGDWQKQRREQEARRRLLAALPLGWRARVLIDPEDAKGRPPVLMADGSIAGRYADLELEAQRRYPDGYSPQLPLLCAVADVLGPVEACFVQGDETPALFMPVLRAHPFRLPLLERTKTQLLHAAWRSGFDDLLALTWSCEADDGDAKVGPCRVCDPCKARILEPAACLVLP